MNKNETIKLDSSDVRVKDASNRRKQETLNAIAYVFYAIGKVLMIAFTVAIIMFSTLINGINRSSTK